VHPLKFGARCFAIATVALPGAVTITAGPAAPAGAARAGLSAPAGAGRRGYGGTAGTGRCRPARLGRDSRRRPVRSAPLDGRYPPVRPGSELAEHRRPRGSCGRVGRLCLGGWADQRRPDAAGARRSSDR
jgi:hypothetical protein